MKLLKKVYGVNFIPYQSEIINIDEKFYKVKTREYIFDKMFSGKDNINLKIFVEKEDLKNE